MASDSDEISVGFILVGDNSTASSRHRVLDPTKFFDDSIECRFLSLNSSHNFELSRTIFFLFNFLLLTWKSDIIYIQKAILPRVVFKLTDFLRTKVVFDFDDAIYTSPEWEDDDPERRERLITALESATVVITGNPNLSTFAEEYNDKVYTLPTPVPKDDMISGISESDTVTIGWIGGANNLRYLELIEEPLLRILNDYKTELVIVSGTELPDNILESHGDIEHLVWELEKEHEQLSRFDFMIRPMADTEWINGKGGYTSIIRCMSIGIPVIASSIEPLEKITNPGNSILFASTNKEWYSKMEELIDNPEKRREIGIKARQEVSRQKLWTEDYANELQDILKSVAK
ncbi:glycosyltransferase family protein [Haloplanus vescus]|nr:glycosyltransferase [Haloplanus vescus]